MDSESSVCGLKNGRTASSQSIPVSPASKSSNDDCSIMKEKDVTELPPSTAADKSEVCLGPITPYSNREYCHNFTPPPTLVSSLRRALRFDFPQGSSDESINSSPQTPRDGVFDPFAPGHDKLVLAPQCRKYTEEYHVNVARRLKFGSSAKSNELDEIDTDTETMDSEEEMLFQTVYGTLLRAIISKQMEQFMQNAEADGTTECSILDVDSDGFKTPTNVPLLSGIADTCPPAPVKANRFRNVDKVLCRKLEF